MCLETMCLETMCLETMCLETMCLETMCLETMRDPVARLPPGGRITGQHIMQPKNRGGRRPPRGFRSAIGPVQLGTAAFGFSGKAALLAVPRSRSSAILIALSSDSFGGT